MPNNLINKIISFTAIIFLSGGCIPFSKEDTQRQPARHGVHYPAVIQQTFC